MAGYSSTPLVKKLGVRSGMRIIIIDPPCAYGDLVADLPEQLDYAKQGTPDADFIHAFYTRADFLLSEFRDLKGSLAPRGMLWISWPKRGSGIETDLHENLVRETGLTAGLVDVKVCAVDERWSGLKFVYRLKDRP
jgi:hypothetical protein